MERNVFEVKYNEHSKTGKGSKDASVTVETSTVVAPHAEDAIKRVRGERVGETWDWEDDNGRKRIAKVVRVDIVSVNRVCGLDYW